MLHTKPVFNLKIIKYYLKCINRISLFKRKNVDMSVDNHLVLCTCSSCGYKRAVVILMRKCLIDMKKLDRTIAVS